MFPIKVGSLIRVEISRVALSPALLHCLQIQLAIHNSFPVSRFSRSSLYNHCPLFSGFSSHAIDVDIMVQLLEIGVLGISRPIKSWWQWAFIGITAATALVGLLSFLFVLFSTIRGWAKVLS